MPRPGLRHTIISNAHESHLAASAGGFLPLLQRL
jgi:hypothetical protein